LLHAASAAAPRQLPHPLLERRQRLVRHTTLDRLISGHPQAVAQKLATEHAGDRALAVVDRQVQLLVQTPQQRHHPYSGTATANVDVRVVGVAHEAVAAPLQFLVYLVKQHVGQQRRQRPTWRRPPSSLLHHAIAHDPAVEVRPDQPDDSGGVDAFAQAAHENVVVDPIEELLQVHVHHDSQPRLHVRQRGQYRVLRSPPRSEAIAVLAEARVKNRLQHLQQCLLVQPFHHRRDTKLTLATVSLWNRHSPYRIRPVRPRQQSLSNVRPRRHQILRRLVDVQSVDARSASVVGFDTLERPLQLLSRERSV
jgi:hypothetical protein